MFSFAQDTDRTGRYFVSLSTLTSLYDYDKSDARKELPSKIKDQLNDHQLSGSESDIVNANFGFGYYVTHNLAISMNYATGIELDLLDDLFRSKNYNFDLDILSIEGTYHVYELSPSVSAFGLAGLSRFTVDAEIIKDVTDKTSASINETSVHAGLGLNWDINENWAMKAGYTYYDFMSINKTYSNIEYRF
jgi:opacity protein-like surface antigen